MEDEWTFVKKRTAAEGAVWVNQDRSRFKRTGDRQLESEAVFQERIAALGYPVPVVLESGSSSGSDPEGFFFVEPSLGPASLHDAAWDAVGGAYGPMPDAVVDAAAAVGVRLLKAQARHAESATGDALNAWVQQAGWTVNVFAENPDLDTPRTRAVLETALDWLGHTPLCWAHYDYGLPNAFPAGVIDWQHHGLAPVGYDTYPALEIIAFKGGTKGYYATPAQRERYTTALDETALHVLGSRPGRHLGEFLLIKCLFFLALMKPADLTNTDKVLKWNYRRTLFTMGVEQYERTGRIDTAAFPSLDDFAAQPEHCRSGGA
ncbi:phosphotransferase (plasmid) [Streptomyces goshikiensis]|uniref:phosphotransferase n=1 Tax=Streptomyces goshikiensis TaxID=1942 RepID=UPI002F90BFF2|nr:phosphotransferase [Streptomyces goshikiensis]